MSIPTYAKYLNLLEKIKVADFIRIIEAVLRLCHLTQDFYKPALRSYSYTTQSNKIYDVQDLFVICYFLRTHLELFSSATLDKTVFRSRPELFVEFIRSLHRLVYDNSFNTRLVENFRFVTPTTNPALLDFSSLGWERLYLSSTEATVQVVVQDRNIPTLISNLKTYGIQFDTNCNDPNVSISDETLFRALCKLSKILYTGTVADPVVIYSPVYLIYHITSPPSYIPYTVRQKYRSAYSAYSDCASVFPGCDFIFSGEGYLTFSLRTHAPPQENLLLNLPAGSKTYPGTVDISFPLLFAKNDEFIHLYKAIAFLKVLPSDMRTLLFCFISALTLVFQALTDSNQTRASSFISNHEDSNQNDAIRAAVDLAYFLHQNSFSGPFDPANLVCFLLQLKSCL